MISCQSRISSPKTLKGTAARVPGCGKMLASHPGVRAPVGGAPRFTRQSFTRTPDCAGHLQRGGRTAWNARRSEVSNEDILWDY